MTCNKDYYRAYLFVKRMQTWLLLLAAVRVYSWTRDGLTSWFLQADSARSVPAALDSGLRLGRSSRGPRTLKWLNTFLIVPVHLCPVTLCYSMTKSEQAANMLICYKYVATLKMFLSVNVSHPEMWKMSLKYSKLPAQWRQMAPRLMYH